MNFLQTFFEVFSLKSLGWNMESMFFHLVNWNDIIVTKDSQVDLMGVWLSNEALKWVVWVTHHFKKRTSAWRWSVLRLHA